MKTVPCSSCGTDTPMTASHLCYDCWRARPLNATAVDEVMIRLHRQVAQLREELLAKTKRLDERISVAKKGGR